MKNDISLEDSAWRKSSRSGMGNCVEVAADGGRVGVRDSKHREGAVLAFDAQAWTSFLSGLKSGPLR
ncbi:DUF397 domain-containing protein [Cryptosporangium sp. NPDC051539]|uniref:DUF397 domain-containing protein n=1 Tax=Cryptosporangium sp. NPDC051539 TaxID=3363962 RepID=UPI00379D9F77